jgi:hypothetical protein
VFQPTQIGLHIVGAAWTVFCWFVYHYCRLFPLWFNYLLLPFILTGLSFDVATQEEVIKDEEYHRLFVDLCKALASLQRYWEALEIVNLARRLDAKMLPVETKKELQSLGASDYLTQP